MEILNPTKDDVSKAGAIVALAIIAKMDLPDILKYVTPEYPNVRAQVITLWEGLEKHRKERELRRKESQ